MPETSDPRVDELVPVIVMLARLAEAVVAVHAQHDDVLGVFDGTAHGTCRNVGTAALNAAEDRAMTVLAPHGLTLRLDLSATSLHGATALYAAHETPEALEAAIRKAIVRALAAADAAKAGA